MPKIFQSKSQTRKFWASVASENSPQTLLIQDSFKYCYLFMLEKQVIIAFTTLKKAIKNFY
jgi:hypothetical protein